MPLSAHTEARLQQLFAGECLDEARQLLEEGCGEGVAGWRSVGLDRLRAAVLKLSDGSIAKLVDAIAVAQTDFRDALVAAGFADDTDAHERWWPE